MKIVHTTYSKIVLTIILLIVILLFPIKASAQWGFDVAVVEAYINDHKQQRSLLLARSTLELSNQLLHEYSSEATVDYKNLNVDLDKYTRVNPNQVTALRCQFTPEYTRPAAIGTTRALLQGVEFQKWNGKATDDKETPDDGGNTDGGDDNENPLG